MKLNLSTRAAINVDKILFYKTIYWLSAFYESEDTDPYPVNCDNIAASTFLGCLCLQVRAHPQPQLERLAKVGGLLSMYISHVTGGDMLCWANVVVIWSL